MLQLELELLLEGHHLMGQEAFEAQRVQGNDFFATTTFRVGKDPLTFVVGGWGGTVVGLSNGLASP